MINTFLTLQRLCMKTDLITKYTQRLTPPKQTFVNQNLTLYCQLLLAQYLNGKPEELSQLMDLTSILTSFEFKLDSVLEDFRIQMTTGSSTIGEEQPRIQLNEKIISTLANGLDQIQSLSKNINRKLVRVGFVFLKCLCTSLECNLLDLESRWKYLFKKCECRADGLDVRLISDS